MNIPESIKIEPNMAVVFKNYFEFNGLKYNAIVQRDDGTMLFFDTESYHADAMYKVFVEIKENTRSDKQRSESGEAGDIFKEGKRENEGK